MTSTHRALAEIQSTSLKAARGAGCPWGLAEEAGHATRLLEAHGLPGAKALATLLSSPRGCSCGSGTGAACGLFDMAGLMDAPPDPPVTVGPVVAPLLLLVPFFNGQQTWHLTWDGGAAHIGPDGATLVGTTPDHPTEVTARPVETWPKLSPPSLSGRMIDAEVWTCLEQFAARVYVPETAASRASGAGPD